MVPLLEFLLSLLGNVISDELSAWAPKLATRLIQRNANKFPPSFSARVLEEWQALLDDTPGAISKLWVAVSLSWASQRMLHEHCFPEVPYRPFAFRYLRAFDFLAALSALVLLAPLLLLISLFVKLSSKGPIFEPQLYIGKAGIHVRVWKFRTHSFTENPSYPDRSLIGSFLAWYALDELPMLWNVLTGDMTLIGSRPREILKLSDPVRFVFLSRVPGLFGKLGIVGLRSEELARFWKDPIRHHLVILVKVAKRVFLRSHPRNTIEPPSC